MSGGRKNRSGSAIYEEIEPPSQWSQDSLNHWLILRVPGFQREEVRLEVNTDGYIRIGGERKISGIKYIWFEQIFKAPQNSKPEDCRVRLEDGVFFVTIPKLPAQTIPAPAPAKTPRVQDSDHEMGKKVNLNESTIQELPSVKTPKHEEDSDHVKGKKVNQNEGTIQELPSVKTPKHEEDSDHEKGKKVKENGDCPNKNEGTSEEERYHDTKGEDKSNEGSFLAKVAYKVKENRGIFLTAILAFALGTLVSQCKVKRTDTEKNLMAKLDLQNHNNIQ